MEWIYDNVPAFEEDLEKSLFSQCIQWNLLKNEHKNTRQNARDAVALRVIVFFFSFF